MNEYKPRNAGVELILALFMSIIKRVKAIFFLSSLMFHLLLKGQSIFPGRDTILLSGKLLKVKPLERLEYGKGYSHFFKDEKMKKVFDEVDYIYSNPKRLESKIFEVVSITSYTYLTKDDRFKIKLFNKDIGTLYYLYDPYFESSWPFEFYGDFKYPENYFCKKITTDIDKFRGDTTFTSPYVGTIQIFKKIEKGNIYYFLIQKITSSSLDINKKGFFLLLKNGSKISKPENSIEVEVNKNGPGYLYTGIMMLNKDDIALLTSEPITDTRLYLHDSSISLTNGEQIQQYLRCLIDKTVYNF